MLDSEATALHIVCIRQALPRRTHETPHFQRRALQQVGGMRRETFHKTDLWWWHCALRILHHLTPTAKNIEIIILEHELGTLDHGNHDLHNFDDMDLNG